MKGTLFVPGGTAVAATADGVRAAIAAGSFFWLDLDTGGATAQEAFALLSDDFHFHPLALEDAEHFTQRPKFDDYDNYDFLVVHGAKPGGQGTQEVHLFVGGTYLVSVHHGDCATLEAARDQFTRRHATSAAGPQVVLLYLVVDGLTDSFFPVLSEFDDRIDNLQNSILQRPTEEQLGEIFDMKRQLMLIRKVITPQRDMFAGITAGVLELPGESDESPRYFRDLYDHLIRISDMVDGYRDLVSGVMDTHISTVSNRLNVVMKQLAIIATVFLPLSFLTGFFGQNDLYGWMVGHITSGWTFVWLGLGSEVVAVVILLALFKRRGWMGGPSA